MKNKKFKPILAPTQLASFKPTDDPKKYYVGDIKFPILASYKIDGIRCIFKKGEIISRSLKQIQNKQLREKFSKIADYSKENNCIIDGEIYNHSVPFQFITSCVMTHDYNDKKSVKAWLELCKKHKMNVSREDVLNGLKFYCFDMVIDDDFEVPYRERINHYYAIKNLFSNKIYQEVNVFVIDSILELKKAFDHVIENNYEGLILRDPKGVYKCGRGTIKQGLIYKVKPFENTDSKIIGVIQSTVVKSNIKKTKTELGYSRTSKKKNDRIYIDMASAFMVDYNGKNLKVTLSMTDAEKKEVWKNRKKYIGRYVEYKYLEVGMKDDGLPRHPNTIRMRDDKDEN